MKKYCIFILMLVFATACDVLDVDPKDKYSETTAWASIKNLDYYVKSFYGILYVESTSEIRGVNLSEGYTDLVKFTRYGTTSYHNRFFASLTSMTPANSGSVLSNWTDMYKRIRQVNEYFEDLSNGYGAHLDPEQLAVRTAEARFLRAFAYQELIIRHGGVILRVSENHVDDHNDRNKARSSEEDCWDFVIEEYKKALGDLPYKWDSSNTGRVTKGAAWGMIARSALYAERWDDAIAACKEVIKIAEEQGLYELLQNYQSVFTATNNKELILQTNFQSKDLQHNFDLNFAPSGDGAAKNVQAGGLASPTDEFASQFDIQIDGVWKKFDWNEVVSKGLDPWKNRDPRFYATILYNGASWKGRTLELYDGGSDGFLQYAESGNDDQRKSVTGYAFRKFIKENTDEDFIFTLSDQFWIEMRYAEIYLIMSEAYARKNQFTEAYQYLNTLRTTRSSVQLPALGVKSNWDSYLDDLQKERICELGLEGHRFWDLSRWGIASKVLNASRVHGIKITKNSDGTFKYERVESDVKDRVFPEKYSIMPIPEDEIKNNTLCEQTNVWK